MLSRGHVVVRILRTAVTRDVVVPDLNLVVLQIFVVFVRPEPCDVRGEQHVPHERCRRGETRSSA